MIMDSLLLGQWSSRCAVMCCRVWEMGKPWFQTSSDAVEWSDQLRKEGVKLVLLVT